MISKKLAANIALLLSTIIIMLILMEGAARLMAPKAAGGPVLMDYLENDPEAGYDIAKNRAKSIFPVDGTGFEVWSDEKGCFDRPGGNDPSVLLIGDSFTWGFARFEDKWGTLLEEKTGTGVMKCGVLGYGTKQELLKAQKLLNGMKVKPKTLVLGYFMNDLGDDYVFPQSRVVNGGLMVEKYMEDVKTGKIGSHPVEALEAKTKAQNGCQGGYTFNPLITKTLCFLTDHSALYKLVKPALKNAAVKMLGKEFAQNSVDAEHRSFWELGTLSYLSSEKYPWLEEAWKTHLANVKAIKELADKNKMRLLVVLIPSKEQVYPYLRFDSPFAPEGIEVMRPYERLLPFLEANKIEHLDLLPGLKAKADPAEKKKLDPKNDLYYAADGHWNAKGNKLAGLLVAETLAAKNMIESKEGSLEAIRKEISEF